MAQVDRRRRPLGRPPTPVSRARGGPAPLIALATRGVEPDDALRGGREQRPGRLYKTTTAAGRGRSSRSAPDYTGQALRLRRSAAREQGWYDNVLAVDPTHANHVIAGGIAMVETTDGGATWTNVNGQTSSTAARTCHPDQHAIAFRGPTARCGSATTAASTSTPAGRGGGERQRQPQHHAVLLRVQRGRRHRAGRVAGQRLRARTSGVAGPWTGIFSGDGGPSAITPNQPSTQFIEADQHLFRRHRRASHRAVSADITPPATRACSRRR